MNFRKILNFFTLIAVISLISGCDLFYKKVKDPVSEITTYPIFVLEGGEVMTHEIGEPWVEPGYHCSEVEEGADDLTSSVIVDNGGIDVNKADLYYITYTATNSYGFTLSVTRNVLVTEPLDDLYPIGGSYFQGFFPTDDNQMTVSGSEVLGFWDVGNVRDLSNTVEGYIADLGDQTYIVALALLTRKLSNLRYVYVTGTAVFDDTSTPKTLTFYLTEVYDDGTPLSSEKTYIWNLNE